MRKDKKFRVLFIRLSAFGDLVFCLPFLNSLKKSFENCEITWLVQDEFQGFVKSQAAVDHCLAWDKRLWIKNLRRMRWDRFVRQFVGWISLVRSEHYDLVIDAQGLLKSGFHAAIAKSARKVVLGPSERTDLLFHMRVPRPRIARPQVRSPGAEYRQLASSLGFEVEDVRGLLRTGLESTTRFAELCARFPVLGGRYLALIPHTTRPQKHWREEYWPQLVSLLSNSLDIDFVVLGGPDDQSQSEKLFLTSHRVSILTGQTSYAESLEIIRFAEGVVGVDTGMAHAAQSMNKPTVLIFGSTVPYLTYNDPSLVTLWSERPCSTCRRHPTCSGSYDCMRDIRPEAVAENLVGVVKGIST